MEKSALQTYLESILGLLAKDELSEDESAKVEKVNDKLADLMDEEDPLEEEETEEDEEKKEGEESEEESGEFEVEGGEPLDDSALLDMISDLVEDESEKHGEENPLLDALQDILAAELTRVK